ncbi:unnamed protein product [Penicillium camemberti]|uniref:Str. FM013 n=1 Tax=Penicillium camemberti (strain FM 013) TaxID=1429867 RepID=A0A0G4PTG0_PENC3|nr:unnamed protein product [Penicillium camemberti]
MDAMVKSDVVAPVLKCTWVISHAHVLSMDERSTFIDFRAFQGIEAGFCHPRLQALFALLPRYLGPCSDLPRCLVSKKRQGLSTKTEKEDQEVAEEIKYIHVQLLFPGTAGTTWVLSWHMSPATIKETNKSYWARRTEFTEQAESLIIPNSPSHPREKTGARRPN